MDVDANEPISMVSEAPESGDLISLFTLAPELFAWRHHEPILTRRATLSGQLIFDVLLIQGGIPESDTLYPPSDMDTLQTLLDAIQHSKYDTLKKDCLVYYLLKFETDEAKAARFRERRGIPSHFVALAEAYWHLDVGENLTRAVALLSDTRIKKDYTSKIMRILSLGSDPGPLILKYVRSAKPPLVEDADVDAYATALMERSLMEAWSFQRTFPPASSARRRLILKTVDWCLIPMPRKTPLTHLLAFPFTPQEQSTIHEYAINPPAHLPPTAVALLQDLVCVRLVHAGQYAAAIKLDRQFTRGTGGSSASAQDRRKMLDDIQANLPAAERRVLQADLEKLGEPSTSGSKLSGGANLSMSWENLRPQANGYASPRSAAKQQQTQLNGRGTLRSSISTKTPPSTPSALGGARGLFRPGPNASSRGPAPPAPPPIPNSPAAFGLPVINGKPAAPQPLLSSNQTRNAFYNPPLIPTTQPQTTTTSSPFAFTNGASKVTRNAFSTSSRPVDGNSKAPSPPLPAGSDKDVDMGGDGDEGERSEKEKKVRARSKSPSRLIPDDDDEVAPAEYSIFAGKKLPPGTLIPTPEPEVQTRPDETDDTATGHRRPPRRQAAAPKRIPTIVTQPPVEEQRPQRRKRTLPGGFADDDEEDELDDDVPPLPSTAQIISKASSSSSAGSDGYGGRTTNPRKSRRTNTSSRASSVDPDEGGLGGMKVRRSSRLSSAEPPSPEVPTKPLPIPSTRAKRRTSSVRGSTTGTSSRRKK